MLTLNKISKTFFKNTVNEKKALNEVSLHLDKGEFVSILGTNGAGKSTLFNAICGSFLTDSGNVYLDGKNITGHSEHKIAKDIGRMFQNPLKGTAPSMTIEENLSLAYSKTKNLYNLTENKNQCSNFFKNIYSKINKNFSLGINKKDRIFFKEILATLNLGLEDRLKTKVGLLSGGQRQALTLLMATITTPKLLLLDEHTAALDPVTAKKVLKITNDLILKNNITTLMITHNITNALSIGTRTIMMDEGKIVLDIKGEERSNMTAEGLLQLYSLKNNKQLDNDRILFSTVK
jgi:putative ABC transport system ATP-binding protein